MAEKFPVGLPGAIILNGHNRANNSAAESLAKISATLIIFDQSSHGKNADRWAVENYQDGYKIFNMGSNNWASVSGNQVLGVPEFDGERCKWWIEYTGKGQDFWIRVPKAGGAVWTVRPASVQAQTTIFLDPLDEQDSSQHITFIVPA